ncbi:MAG: hypothetical protein KAS32_27835 [Candidatus Peribacteraceae bacterium]|nr:hypothetical protein [Candidatus Peribacteraceae bacterium]
MARITGDSAAIKVCEALGIDTNDVSSLVIDLTCNAVATIAVKRFMTNDQADQLVEILPEVYRLEPIDER